MNPTWLNKEFIENQKEFRARVSFIARVKSSAEGEFKEELFREAVEREKERLRKRRSLWNRIFPWRIIIIKKGEHHA